MIAASMKDVGSDEELSDSEDPELLAELEDLSTNESSGIDYEPPEKTSSPPSITTSSATETGDMIPTLQDRLQNYINAKEAATAAGDSSKARRVDRGIKTLQDMLKRVKCGRAINEEEIPPLVAIHSTKTSPVTSPMNEQTPVIEPVGSVLPPHLTPTFSPTSEPPPSAPPQAVARAPSPRAAATSPPPPAAVPPSISPPPPAGGPPDKERYRMLSQRRDQYKLAAMRAKSAGYGEMAMKYLKTAKQFDRVLQALEQGQPIDLSNMPPPPPGFAGTSPTEHSAMQGSSAAGSPNGEEDEEETLPDLSVEDKQKLFHAPSSASSVMEALQQRLDKYKSSADAAKAEGNSGKSRRMGRIVKQYEDAVKLYRAGKQVDLEELPTPPGFPPFPTATSSTSSLPAPQPKAPPASQMSPQGQKPHAAQGQMAAAAAQAPSRPMGQVSQNRTPPKQMQRQMSLMSRAEQQALFLQERQLAFKKAALQSKNNGDMELAKKYMRMAKGFDQMIEAAHSGLPVDLSQVPALPGSADEQFEFVEGSEADSDTPKGDRDTMYKKLEQELIQQIRTATTNADHFTRLGDVSAASKFDKMCVNARKDLDALKNAYKHGDPVPRFHYETRTFSMVQCCTELGDNDLEIILVRGINYGLPSGYQPTDLDTYVKYEFPFPNDEPQKGVSETVKGTSSPEYNQSFKIQVNRKSRAFLRLLKSKSLKLEVYYKRGFFKGDKLLGVANMKLLSLENQCVVHESVDLAEGRKAVGGKIEVKMRARDPFTSKQVEEVKEKWLVLDQFERALPKPTFPKGPETSANLPTVSIEVLKYEKQLLDRQIQNLQGKMSKAQEDALKLQSTNLAKRAETQRETLRTGGLPALKGYADSIEKMKEGYMDEAKALIKQGNREKAQINLNKKKLIEREVEAIRGRLSKQ